MRKIPWAGATIFLIAILGNAWVIADLVQVEADGSWNFLIPELYFTFGAPVMVATTLLSAWLVFGAPHVAIRAAIVAASIAFLTYEFHCIWGPDSQIVRPDILTAFLVSALLLPRVRGWRAVKRKCGVATEPQGPALQFSLQQLLLMTCLVAVTCSIFPYISRTQSSPEIFLINLVLGLSLTMLSLYGTLVCARPLVGALLVTCLYVAISAALAGAYSVYYQAPYDALITDYNIRSMLLELTLIMVPLLVLRRCGYRLTDRPNRLPQLATE